MWTQTLGEFIGTFILILLGDGVVAGVSLNQSKAKDAGLPSPLVGDWLSPWAFIPPLSLARPISIRR